MYYLIRKEPFFFDDPCDQCGKHGGKSIVETQVTWTNPPKANHLIKCNHCGLQQKTISWTLEPMLKSED